MSGNILQAEEIQLNSVIVDSSICSSEISYLNASTQLIPSLFFFSPTYTYNVSVNELNGKAIVNGASGSITINENTEIVSNQNTNLLFNTGLSVQVFNGVIDGTLYFNAPKEYIQLGGAFSYGILSINPGQIVNNNGYITTSPFSLGISIVTPIVLKFQFEVENPTNVTNLYNFIK